MIPDRQAFNVFEYEIRRIQFDCKTHKFQYETVARIVEISDGVIISDKRTGGEPKLGVLAKAAMRHVPRWRSGIDHFAAALFMALRAMNSHRLRTFLTMLGIMIGGGLEYFSMLIGYHLLLVLVIAFYACALLLHRRQQRLLVGRFGEDRDHATLICP